MREWEEIAFADLAPVLPRLVLVDGLAASGKSTFAARLADTLPLAHVVCMDDFCAHDAAGFWTAPEVGCVASDVVRPWLAGSDARYRPYDWPSRRPAADARVIANAGTLVVEGVYAARLHRPPGTFLVWVACDRKTRWERAMDRDGRESAWLWRHWMAAEDAYLEAESPSARAALVVDGASGSGRSATAGTFTARRVSENRAPA
ncbi:MAG: hypothetical protein HYX33_01215 [Actinobacteria bacterium]|nr:hypothetical protein [Actinomycetota bacterium]